MINEGTSVATGTVDTAVPMGHGAGRRIHRSLRINRLFASSVASKDIGRSFQSALLDFLRETEGFPTPGLSRTGEILYAPVQ